MSEGRNRSLRYGLQIVNTLAVADGGPARNSFELNLALNKLSDLNVDLIWIRGAVKESVIEVVPNEKLPVPGPRRLARNTSPAERSVSARELIRSLKRAEFVIAHGYYLPQVPLLALLSKLLRFKLIITPHGALTPHQRTVHRTKKVVWEALAGWWVRRAASAFVTGSSREADDLKSAGLRTPVYVGGVGTRIPDSFRSDGIPHAPIRLLSLSRIAGKKRIDKSILALSILNERGKEAELIVAGTGDPELLKRLKTLAEAASGQVHFIGAVDGDNKTRTLLEADILVLPSEDENFGIGIAEAAAHGIPVAASSEVAAAAAIRGQGSFTTPSPTPAELADLVEAALATFKESQKSIRAAAEEQFSWDAVSRRWQQVLRTI